MAGISKILSYKSARSTRLLNNAVKDLFGQQRPVTLFGFDIQPSGINSNSIQVGPGGCRNANGQTLYFFDDVSTTIDLNPDPTSSVQMYVLVVEHSYAADTSLNAPIFKIIQVQDYLPRNVAPIKDIQELNIVSGFIAVDSPTLEHSLTDSIEGLNIGGFDTLSFRNGDPILGWNDIPIAKIIVNWGASGITNIVDGTGAFDSAVGIYKYSNPFEQLQDVIGIDYFEPPQRNDDGGIMDNERANDTVVAITGNNPFADYLLTFSGGTSTHDNMKYGAYQTGGEDRVPVNHPLFGFFSNSSNDAVYRYASYLDDGHSLRWNLQRLSETVRILEAKVGDHPKYVLTKSFQSYAPKDLASATSQNLIVNKFTDTQPTFIIKSGNTGWFKPNLGDDYSTSDDFDSLGTTTLGDSHHGAITMLDRALHYIVKNRLGLNGIATTTIDRDDVYHYSPSISSLSFDQESWNVTSLTSDVVNGDTLKSAIQNLVDNKLHRHDGYVDTWIHFGSSTSQNQEVAGSLVAYRTANGVDQWLHPGGVATASLSTPIHIGGQGISVHFYTQYTGGTETITREFGMLLGSSQSINNTYGYGVLFPSTFLDPGQDSPETGKDYLRSTIIGGETLNLTTRKFSDVRLKTMISHGAASAGTVCTISWQAVNTSFGDYVYVIPAGYVSGVITENLDPGLFANIRLTQRLQYVTLSLNAESNPYNKSNRYAPPWSVAKVLGLLSSISIANLATYTLDLNANEFSYTDEDPRYAQFVNIIDRTTGDTTFKFQTNVAAPYPRHISNIPLHAKEHVLLGDLDSVSAFYNKNANILNTSSGGLILGQTISIASDLLNLLSNTITLNTLLKLAGTMRVESAGKIVVDGSMVVNGDVNFESGSTLRFKDGCHVRIPRTSEFINHSTITGFNVDGNTQSLSVFYLSPSLTGQASSYFALDLQKIGNSEYVACGDKTLYQGSTNFNANLSVPLKYFVFPPSSTIITDNGNVGTDLAANWTGISKIVNTISIYGNAVFQGFNMTSAAGGYTETWAGGAANFLVVFYPDISNLAQVLTASINTSNGVFGGDSNRTSLDVYGDKFKLTFDRINGIGGSLSTKINAGSPSSSLADCVNVLGYLNTISSSTIALYIKKVSGSYTDIRTMNASRFPSIDINYTYN